MTHTPITFLSIRWDVDSYLRDGGKLLDLEIDNDPAVMRMIEQIPWSEIGSCRTPAHMSYSVCATFRSRAG